MKIVCSWCKKNMGEKEPLADQNITHSICDECEKKEEEKFEETEKTRTTDTITAP